MVRSRIPFLTIFLFVDLVEFFVLLTTKNKVKKRKHFLIIKLICDVGGCLL